MAFHSLLASSCCSVGRALSLMRIKHQPLILCTGPSSTNNINSQVKPTHLILNTLFLASFFELIPICLSPLLFPTATPSRRPLPPRAAAPTRTATKSPMMGHPLHSYAFLRSSLDFSQTGPSPTLVFSVVMTSMNVTSRVVFVHSESLPGSSTPDLRPLDCRTLRPHRHLFYYHVAPFKKTNNFSAM